ncbi:hypothetical protein GCM10017566_45560 [Amycolatopsis bartoniae]|uniref:Uncharacterized protein n=1 Tax=Amycolatopsis bartoniae TaxID=941986 RepID=A0A8H9J2W9_9PSEU|nr:hypothetical protein GCM10017566_45560 [Amycolatopsis bartoniae]
MQRVDIQQQLDLPDHLIIKHGGAGAAVDTGPEQGPAHTPERYGDQAPDYGELVVAGTHGTGLTHDTVAPGLCRNVHKGLGTDFGRSKLITCCSPAAPTLCSPGDSPCDQGTGAE